MMLGLGDFQPCWAFTSFHKPGQPLKLSMILSLGGFLPHRAFTSFHKPWQSLKSSTILSVLGVFNLLDSHLPPWPSTTPEIEHNAQSWEFSTSLDSHLPPWPLTTPKIEHDAWFWGFSTSTTSLTMQQHLWGDGPLCSFPKNCKFFL